MRRRRIHCLDEKFVQFLGIVVSSILLKPDFDEFFFGGLGSPHPREVFVSSTASLLLPSSFAYYTMVNSPLHDALSATVQKLCPWTFKSTQVEVPDGTAICPDPDERTTGVSCVQIYLVGKLGKAHESLDMNARKSGHRHFPSGTVWTYRLSVWDLNLGMAFPGGGFSRKITGKRV